MRFWLLSIIWQNRIFSRLSSSVEQKVAVGFYNSDELQIHKITSPFYYYSLRPSPKKLRYVYIWLYIVEAISKSLTASSTILNNIEWDKNSKFQNQAEDCRYLPTKKSIHQNIYIKIDTMNLVLKLQNVQVCTMLYWIAVTLNMIKGENDFVNCRKQLHVVQQPSHSHLTNNFAYE